MMRVVAQVECRRSVSKMHMGDDACLLEPLQGAVHGGSVDVRMASTYPRSKLVGCDVLAVGLEQRVDHGPSGHSDAAPGFPQKLQ